MLLTVYNVSMLWQLRYRITYWLFIEYCIWPSLANSFKVRRPMQLHTTLRWLPKSTTPKVMVTMRVLLENDDWQSVWSWSYNLLVSDHAIGLRGDIHMSQYRWFVSHDRFCFHYVDYSDMLDLLIARFWQMSLLWNYGQTWQCPKCKLINRINAKMTLDCITVHGPIIQPIRCRSS